MGDVTEAVRREKKRREVEGQKIFSDRRNKNMIPSGDGNREHECEEVETNRVEQKSYMHVL